MSQLENLTSVHSLQEQLQQAKSHIQNAELSAAVVLLESILDKMPSHRDVLYYLAVCQRRQGDNLAAMSTLEGLVEIHPQYGRAYQELGYNQSALNNSLAAGIAFEQAVNLNSALIASWKALVIYYESQNNKQRVIEALRQVQWLKQLPAQLLTVSGLINEDKLSMAEQVCRGFLQEKPNHMEAMRLLAEIGSKLQILDEAEVLLESCVELYPGFAQAHLDYIQLLHRRRKFEKALQQAKKLHALDPNNIAYEVALAIENQAVGDFDEALRIYDGVLHRAKNAHTVLAARGNTLAIMDRTDEAIGSFQAAFQAKADFGEAYWSLANLKSHRFSDEVVFEMRKQEQVESISSDDRIHLCFALGRALEDRKEYPASFAYYERGNELKRRGISYSPERLESEIQTQHELFDQEFFDKHKDSGCSSASPIFIIGLPGAGAPLLEQILASHSQVDAPIELSNIVGLAHRLGGRFSNIAGVEYPAILKELDSDMFKKFGEDFITDAQLPGQEGSCFIDSVPDNFRHIPLIQLILPNSKIIDARRQPMGSCFSAFKQLFAEGQEFTYGLDEIGRYYRGYVELMDHWDQVLPGRILRVQHEDVMNDLESQVRKMLDYCGLPFEQQCIDRDKTERVIKTLKSKLEPKQEPKQVRQPICHTEIEHWKNYEDYLEPLTNALGLNFNEESQDEK